MRELQMEELMLVSGGHECTVAYANNVYKGVSNPSKVGDDLIGIYEGVVAAFSHVIERVATAW